MTPTTETARTTGVLPVPVPLPRTEPLAVRLHDPAPGLTGADRQVIAAAHELYPEAAYALEHCHCFHA